MSTTEKIKWNLGWQVWILLGVVAIAFTLLNMFTPVTGDDLFNWDVLGRDDFNLFSRKSVSFIGARYVGCNGRILDIVGPLFFNGLPHVIVSIVMGIMASFYFYIVIAACRFSGKNNVTAAIFVISLLLLLLPWWDGMWLLVCQTNYIWSTAFGIFFILLYSGKIDKNENGWYLLLYVVLGFLAGSSHEETGLSVLCGITALLVFTPAYRKMNGRRIALLVSLIFGFIFCMSSPYIWQRAASSIIKTSVPEMVITTLPMVALLVAVLIVTSLTKTGRKFIFGLLSSPWTSFVAVSLAGAIITLYSGIVGRTGWLPETSSVIALFLMLEPLKLKVSRSFAVLASSLMMTAITLCLVLTVVYQYRLKRQYTEVLADYVESVEGLVFKDVYSSEDYPWYVLKNIQGVPDADDLYLLDIMARAYRTDSAMLTLLPPEFKDDLKGLTDSLRIGEFSVYRSLPSDTRMMVHENKYHKIRVITREGKDYILRPVTTMDLGEIWIGSPLVVDKGDHWYSIGN